MTTGIIYLAKNTISNKCYVGQTTRTLEQRKKEHLTQTIKDGYKFGRALRKYSQDSWEWTVLAEVDVIELDEYEQFFIKDLDSFKNGYNCNVGGNWLNESNPRYDSVIYELWHPEHGIIKETVSQLCKRHNSFCKHFYLLVKGERQHINGYVLLKNKSNYDKIIKTYGFYHPDIGVVTCTTKELFNNYRSYFKSKENRIHILTSKRVDIHHGWCLAENKDRYEDLLDISSRVTLIHKEHGILTLKRSDWKEQYGISDSAMTYLVNGRYKSSRGWSLSAINKELYQSSTEVTEAVKENMLTIFKSNKFYSSKDIKQLLQKQYEQLKLSTKAKASDIEQYLNVKSTTKRIDNKVTKGYLIN